MVQVVGFYLSLAVMKGVPFDALCEGGEPAPDKGIILGPLSHRAFLLLCGWWVEVVSLSASLSRSLMG
jgi:hypothetical protein